MSFRKGLLASILVSAFVLSAACGGDDGGGPDLPGDDNLGGVITDGTGAPIGGATVTVLGGSASATADAEGLFSLQVATDVELDFLVEAPGYWGRVLRGNISSGDTVGDIEVDLVSDAEVAEVATALSRTISDSDGIVLGEFWSNGPDLAGLSFSILDDNMPVESDAPFTFDDNDDPVESDTLLGGTMEVLLLYTGVPVGAYEVFGSITETVGCSPEYDTLAKPFPVRAKAISTMNIYCGGI